MMLKEFSRVTGLTLGTVCGVVVAVYGAGEVVSGCLNYVIP